MLIARVNYPNVPQMEYFGSGKIREKLLEKNTFQKQHSTTITAMPIKACRH